MADAPTAFTGQNARIREHVEKRSTGLAALRKPWEIGAQETARNTLRYISPFMRNLGDERSTATNQGGQANNRLYNSKAARAHRTLSNGMSSGMSSPSQPWFKLKLTDEALKDVHAVKEWIDDVTAKLYSFLSQTNIYTAMQSDYRELGVFGSGVVLFTPHWQYGGVAYSLTFGEYWLGQDDGLRVDTLMRDCSMTVSQLSDRYPDDRLSMAVKRLRTAKKFDERVPCRHLIEPNRDRAYGKMDRANKPYRSIYWEVGSDNSNLLDIGGFDRKPIAAPRWEAMGSEVYSTGPGFDALPDARKLQLQEIRLQQSMDFLVRPALGMPVGDQNRGANLIPGGVTWTSEPGAGRSSALWEVPYGAVNAISQDITTRTEPAIDEAFFAHLFMAITNMPGLQPRNVAEIARRNEEQLSQLGPVVDRVQVEKLSVIVMQAFSILSDAGKLPAVPPEAQGKEIALEFVSILAQAQRMIGLGSMERALGFIGNIAGVKPEILDLPDFDQMVNEYTERLGLPARTLRPAEDVAADRQARQAAQAQQQMTEAAPALKDVAAGAELLSRTNVASPSALTALLPQPGV